MIGKKERSYEGFGVYKKKDVQRGCLNLDIVCAGKCEKMWWCND